MEKEVVIERVSEALKDDCGAFFIGSGISYESTWVDWFKLLEPLTSELGIKINNETDDLPLIAQYIVNQYAGNKGPLINQISKAFNKKFSTNRYHKALATTKISSIWTTNYDMLLESAFAEFLVDVKVNEDSISRNVINSEIEIIKMHGCISKSHHKEIIITAEDYEDYLVNKPAISQRLCNDLLKKTFLFIGYSYRDPNIRNIMVMARRLCNNSTKEHFLILKRDCDENVEKRNEKNRRQELWCQDLKRLGISTLFIDNYDELEEILLAISQKSRGKTVYVTGSHKGGNEVAQQLGIALAREKNVVLISGQSSGIGANIVSAFMEQCILDKEDINGRIRIFPNPYAANAKYSDDFSLLPQLKKYRTNLLNSTQIAVIFNGGKGTEAEVEVAINRNCIIIPVVVNADDRECEVMKKILQESSVMDKIKAVDIDYYSKLIGNVVTVEDVHRCVMKFLE